ncbi:3' terminal RNA ribose 2'-O-methyltransferase Hen1 [Radiobacillus sp. PE A8.2]|uniref:3' terminal RNA ribose 2'-O-methyltransferase Hen1 n=1 Tax=Radiobacillus sp. PE A8.2 TaxID=3380349 RepID=UPI0038903F8F
MQLTIHATGENVQVLSFLLAKNPTNLYERESKGHLVRMFYSKFMPSEVEATIFVTPDSIELVKNNNNAYDITHYINDREFAVSSIFTSLIRSALATALNGNTKEEYQAWVKHCFPFTFGFGPVSTDLSDEQITNLFEPLGYEIDIEKRELDYDFSLKTTNHVRYINIHGTTTLQTGLRQLFVLIPVLDNYKHYYIDEKEIDKLQRYGEGWLDQHPSKDMIIRRALRFKELYSQLEDKVEQQETTPKVRLNELRYQKIAETVQQLTDRKSIVDFGSGEGKLAYKLGFVSGVEEILAVEPSETATTRAIARFEHGESEVGFVSPTPVWGSLYYFDQRLVNKDVIILCEVIEHIDEYRLPKIIQTILQKYQPRALIITTPNSEYNNVYELDQAYRHSDHRFEWTRNQFQACCTAATEQHPYRLHFDGIGEEHPSFGQPTQMCTFIRGEDQV